MTTTSAHSSHRELDGAGLHEILIESHRLRSEAFRDYVIRPVSRALRNLLERLAERNRRVRSIRELSSLSDATLKDIGLPRCEIPFAAAELAARRRLEAEVDRRPPGNIEATPRFVSAEPAANDDALCCGKCA